MGLRLEITAETPAELSSHIVGMFQVLGIAGASAPPAPPVEGQADGVEELGVVEPPKRTRKAKPVTIEATATEKSPTPAASSGGEPANSTGDTPTEAAAAGAEAPASEPAKPLTYDEVRAQAIAYVNLVGEKNPDNEDAKRVAFAKLLGEFGIEKIGQIKPERYDELAARIAALVVEIGG